MQFRNAFLVAVFFIAINYNNESISKDLFDIYGPVDQHDEETLKIYQATTDTLFKNYIINTVGKINQAVPSIEGVSVKFLPSNTENFPGVIIDGSSIIIPFHSILLMDDALIAYTFLEHIGKDPSRVLSYLANITCENTDQSIEEYLEIDRDQIEKYEDNIKISDLHLQTILLWILSKEIAGIISDQYEDAQYANAFAIEIFRNFGFPPTGLGFYARVKSLFINYGISSNEIKTRQIDSNTLERITFQSGYVRGIAFLIEKNKESLSQSPLAKKLTENVVDDLFRLGYELQDGILVNDLISACLPNSSKDKY